MFSLQQPRHIPTLPIRSAPIGCAEPGVMHCSKAGSSSITLSVARQQWNRWVEAKRLGGLEIEKQLDPCALLDRSLGKLLALGNPTPSAATFPRVSKSKEPPRNSL